MRKDLNERRSLDEVQEVEVFVAQKVKKKQKQKYYEDFDNILSYFLLRYGLSSAYLHITTTLLCNTASQYLYTLPNTP